MERADVAIVGGGVIGWSVAYHLLLAHPNLKVTVVERNSGFGMGSTGRAAGGVRAQFGSPVNIDLSLHSIRFFETEAEQVDFRQVGYLFVTSSQEVAERMRLAAELQIDRGAPVSLLTPSEVARRAPYLNTGDICLGAFSPTDGFLDPYGVCRLFHGKARAMGATSMPSTAALSRDGDRLHTDGVSLTAPLIVLSCGHWSATLGSSMGLKLPVVAEKHQLALTEPVRGLPDELPMVVDADTSFHFRREGERLLIGYNDPLSQDGDPDAEPAFDFGFLERLAAPALRRLPLLETVGFETKNSWAGFYAETPDKHAIVGRVGDIVVATGFGGHGIMHSPAAGLAAAELALYGECRSFDIRALRPERFEEGDLTQELMVI